MKIGIVGSRTRNTPEDYQKVNDVFEKWFFGFKKKYGYEYGDIRIVSGGQKLGADGWAEGIAAGYQLPMYTFYAPWIILGEKAGPIRNRFIVEESDILIACLGKESKGTADCIRQFKKYKPKGQIILV